MAFSLRENTNAEFREKIAQLFCGKVFKFKNMIWTMTFSMERWKERKRTHGDIS